MTSEDLDAKYARLDERVRGVAFSLDLLRTEVRAATDRRAVSWPAVVSSIAAVVSCAVVLFTR